MLDRLKADGARVIAIDIQFTTGTEERDDRALYNAVRRAGNVVLATTEVRVNGGSSLTEITTRTNVLGGDRNLKAATCAAVRERSRPSRASLDM